MPVNAIDLTDLASVKSRAEVTTTNDDADIQLLITAFSQYVLTRTGRDFLNSVATYTEVYDGNSSTRLFLRNSPITSVTSVKSNGKLLAKSAEFGQAGYIVDQSGKSISIRGGWRFCRGIGNVEVVYSAGYTSVPADLQSAVTNVVAINYKRKAWLDLKSKTLAAGASATTSYRDWEMPPHDNRIILSYERVAM